MALSESEELELLELENENALAATPKSGMEKFTKLASDTLEKGPITAVKDNLRTVGEGLSAPTRGLRGLGVLAEKEVQAALPGGYEPTQEEALTRAAEATKPGYRPQPGEKIGSIVGESALLAPVAGVVPMAAGMAAQAGSERLAETGDIKKAGSTAAIHGATGLVVGGAAKGTEALLVGLQSLYRGLVGSAKGVSKKVVDEVFETASGDATPTVKEAASKFFERLTKLKNEANEGLEKATSTPGRSVAAEDVAEEAAKYAQALSDEVRTLSDEAATTLRDVPTIAKEQVIAPFQQVKAQLLERRLNIGMAQKQALKMLNRWQRSLNEMVTKGGASEQFIKKTIKTIDDDASWKDIAGTPVESALRQVRHGLDNVLKKSNPNYAKAMEPVAKKVAAQESFQDALKFSFGPNKTIIPTDQTVTAMKSLAKGTRPMSEKAINTATLGRPGETEIGFTGISNLAKSEAAGEAKETAVKAAEKAIPKDVPEFELRSLAESAARAGKGSPRADELALKIEEMLPGQGKEMADKLITAAANELYKRGKSNTTMAGAAAAAENIGGSGAALGFDRVLKGLQSAAKGTKRATVPLTKALAGEY